MENIRTFQGLISWNDGMLKCLLEEDGYSIGTIVSHKNREGCLPGDVAEVYFLPIKKWKTMDGDKLSTLSPNEFKRYFNDNVLGLLMRNHSEVYSTNDIMRLIMERKQGESMIVPTIGVVQITKPKTYDNVQGYVMFGYFIPDDPKLCQVEAVDERTGDIIEQLDGKVAGMIDRETNKFWPRRTVSQSRRMKKEEKDALWKRITEKINQIKRMDCLSMSTFTIDTPDCGMFDDAITVEQIDENTIELGVHCGDFITMLEPNSKQLNNYMICQHLSKTFQLKHSFHIGKILDSFSVFITIDIPSRAPTNIYAGPSQHVVKCQFSWSSFNETVKSRRMMEERVDQKYSSDLIQKSLQLVDSMLKIGMFESAEHVNHGEEIINMLGKWFGIMMYLSLAKKYGERYVIKTYNYSHFISTFRSPLRKREDVFIARQLIASSLDMSLEEMMYFVCGIQDPDEFVTFISNVPTRWG